MMMSSCLRGFRRRERQYIALYFSPGFRLSHKRKQELVDDIEMHASSSDGNHDAVCRFLLSMLTKSVIDGHIQSVAGCAKPTTKQGSIELFIRLDRGRGGGNVADGGGADSGAADLPPPPFPPPPAAPEGGPAELAPSLDADAADHQRGGPADLAPSLVAPADLEPSAGIIVLADGADRGKKLRRKLHKRWAKAASRKILSRNITNAIKTVLERSAPSRKLADVLRDVAHMVGNPLTRGAALVFAHRKLQKSLIRRPKRRRRKRARFVEHDGVGLPPCMEMRLMWEADLWKHKHSLLMSPEIFSHNKKLRIARPPQDDEEDDGDW